MSFTLHDLGTENFEFSANVWNWKAALEIIKSLDIVSEGKIRQMSVKATGGQMAKGLIFMVIGNFFMAYVFAHNIEAWSFVPDMDQMSANIKILNAAVFTWLGFYVPIDLSRVAWEKSSWKLFFINTGYHLAMLLVAATILTMM